MMNPGEVEILLVEDGPRDVRLTLHALEKENVKNRVEVVRDGEEALDFVFLRGEAVGAADGMVFSHSQESSHQRIRGMRGAT